MATKQRMKPDDSNKKGHNNNWQSPNEVAVDETTTVFLSEDADAGPGKERFAGLIVVTNQKHDAHTLEVDPGTYLVYNHATLSTGYLVGAVWVEDTGNGSRKEWIITNQDADYPFLRSTAGGTVRFKHISSDPHSNYDGTGWSSQSMSKFALWASSQGVSGGSQYYTTYSTGNTWP